MILKKIIKYQCPQCLWVHDEFVTECKACGRKFEIENQTFCIEPHGDGYALYHGRDLNHHGMNLCKLSEFDGNGEFTRTIIVNALNDNEVKPNVIELLDESQTCDARHNIIVKKINEIIRRLKEEKR